MLVGALTFNTALWFHSPYTSHPQSINQSINQLIEVVMGIATRHRMLSLTSVTIASLYLNTRTGDFMPWKVSYREM